MTDSFERARLFFSLRGSVVFFIRKARLVVKCLCGLLGLTLLGCTLTESKMVAGNIAAINHVEGTAINWFSVNGYRAHGGGGSSCCIIMPVKWRPGLEVDVEWEVDPNSSAEMPSVTSNKFHEVYARHAENYRVYRAVVAIPEWPEKKSCDLKVHFLTCNRVAVTTACAIYGRPDYPIREPRRAKEPAVCLK